MRVGGCRSGCEGAGVRAYLHGHARRIGMHLGEELRPRRAYYTWWPPPLYYSSSCHSPYSVRLDPRKGVRARPTSRHQQPRGRRASGSREREQGRLGWVGVRLRFWFPARARARARARTRARARARGLNGEGCQYDAWERLEREGRPLCLGRSRGTGEAAGCGAAAGGAARQTLVPRHIASRAARQTCAREWRRVSPSSAPRARGSVTGVREPCRVSSILRPSDPRGTRSASASSSASEISHRSPPKSRTSHCSADPVLDWPPSAIARCGSGAPRYAPHAPRAVRASAAPTTAAQATRGREGGAGQRGKGGRGCGAAGGRGKAVARACGVWRVAAHRGGGGRSP